MSEKWDHLQCERCWFDRNSNTEEGVVVSVTAAVV